MHSQPSAPVIVRRSVKAHARHHGGAWKVAYADFVTAMMALFIVLWLVNADEATRKAVAGYFKDAAASGTQTGSAAAGSGENLVLQQRDMSKLKEKIEHVMRNLPELSGNLHKQVQMTVTGEGLRIELLENEAGLFFATGDAQPTQNGRGLLTVLAAELQKIPNSVLVEGHTDARPFASGGTYSNWELSVDRANAARRTLEGSGLPSGRIRQVRGFADQRLRLPAEPENPSNRRVSLVVEYVGGAAMPPQTQPPNESPPRAPGPSTHRTSTSPGSERPPARASPRPAERAS